MRNSFIMASAVIACFCVPLSSHAEIDQNLRAAAGAGDTESQFRLGITIYWGSDGGARDIETGRVWLRKAADKGHPEAQFALGYDAFQDGKDAEGLHWWDLSAKGGSAQAQFSLGQKMVYYTGFETHYYPDTAEVLDLLNRSAVQNYPQAMFLLGQLYAHKLMPPTLQLVKLDPAKAREWYTKAATLGSKGAQAELDTMRDQGDGYFVAQPELETFWVANPNMHADSKKRADTFRAMREGRIKDK